MISSLVNIDVIRYMSVDGEVYFSSFLCDLPIMSDEKKEEALTFLFTCQFPL